MKAVNRDSPLPAYYQIAVDMRERIHLREWLNGEQIPPEPELAKIYGVSRVTMRQALAVLTKDGLLIRRRGSGTFIQYKPPPLVYEIDFPISYSIRLREKGYEPASHTLLADVYTSPFPHVARQLDLESEQAVAYLKRLLTLNEEPIAIDRSWFSDRLCPAITTENLIEGSISKTLSQRYGLTPVKSSTLLDVMQASDEDAHLLSIYPGAALILLTTTTYLEDGTPLEYSTTSWVSERVRFRFNLNTKVFD